MFKKSLLLWLLIPLMALTSCSEHQKLLKSTDNELKYGAALNYYDAKKYGKALQLLEQIKSFYRGTDRAEKIDYMIADAYFQNDDYFLARYNFKQYLTNYPTSPRAEEAAYLAAYSSYKNSPPPTLDQEYTHEAIKDVQQFVNMFPRSNRVPEANRLMDEMRQKLETKAYLAADLYYKMEEWKAAVLGFQNLLKDYPDTHYKEEALYKIAKAYFSYAARSFEDKQRERYQLAVEAVDNLAASYPQSVYMAEMRKLQQDGQRILNN